MTKYNSKRTTIDGITFDSKAEAEHYQVLKMSERAGEIQDLVIHPIFRLQDAFKYAGKTERAISYEADFQWLEDGVIHVADVKGVRTEVYKIKRKLFLKKFGDNIKFEEIGV